MTRATRRTSFDERDRDTIGLRGSHVVTDRDRGGSHPTRSASHGANYCLHIYCGGRRACGGSVAAADARSLRRHNRGGGGGGGGGGAALPPPQPIGMEVSVPNRKREREVGEPASDAKVARVEDASVVAAVPGKKKGGRPAKEKTAESDDGIHQCVACLMTLSQRPNLGRHWLRITRRLMLRGVIPTTLSGEALGKEPRATRKEPGSIACLYAAHVQTEGRNPNGIAPPAGWVPAAGPGSAGSVARHGVPAASSSQACSCGCRICSGHGSGIFRRGF